jgi:hypothetical protein
VYGDGWPLLCCSQKGEKVSLWKELHINEIVQIVVITVYMMPSMLFAPPIVKIEWRDKGRRKCEGSRHAGRQGTNQILRRGNGSANYAKRSNNRTELKTRYCDLFHLFFWQINWVESLG